MRRPFKSYLRHSLNKRRVVSGPSEPEIIEVTVLPEWDTVLRYDGSPLMVQGTVNDPGDDVAVVPGDNVSYQNNDENSTSRDWIAIGLGTDNDPVDKFRSPNPIDEFNAQDGIDDGVIYTNTGPTRSVLSFNLEDIPAGAIIEEAFLELVPVTDKSTGDVWNEFDGENTNVWPDTGVQCEILNLIRDIEETCTWNTSSNASTTINGFEYPIQENRWHRQPNSETLPNPFGAMQNSKRWDVQEGSGLFSSQYNGTASLGDIDNENREKYGHVGYGSMGGGAVENVPNDVNELDDFRITKDDHDNQMTTGNANVPAIQSINVGRSVRYAHENQVGKCNLLLRATHWDVTDLDEDQTEESFTPETLRLDSIGLEDATDTDDAELDTTVEISNDAIVRFTPATFDEDGDDSTVDPITWLDKATKDGWNVTYDWRVSYPPITDLSFDVTLTRGGTTTTIWDQDSTESNIVFQSGDELNIINISSEGGFDNVHRFEFYIGDGTGSGRDGGINSPLVIGVDDVPEAGTNSISVFFNVDARAQGANDPTGLQFFPSQAAGDPASQQGGEGDSTDGSTDPIRIGEIEAGNFEIIEPTFSSELVIEKDDAVITEFDSPIDLTSVYRVTYTFTINNIRPGFDWNVFPEGGEFYIFNSSITDTGTGTSFDPQIVSDTKTVNSTTAQNEIVIEFTGQDLVDGSILRGNLCVYVLGLLNYTESGTDENGDQYTDTFSDSSNVFQFNIAEDNTTNDFDITNPAKRRGVFTTTNLVGPLLNRSGSAEERIRLGRDESLVKTNMFQRELAPCQLDCGVGAVFKTALLPIEERSRFSDIQATKNKFAQLNTDSTLDQNAVLSIDDSNILLSDDSIPAVQGSETATVSLITSGGAGEMVTRKRDGVNIVLPSDLAVYYYNESGADIGWVYYRALSKKLDPGPTTNTIDASDLSDDYTETDFNVTNTDDGMKFIAWEKISPDGDGEAGFIANPLDESNTAGAHIFLLDDRYDFVETPDVSNWPIPFSAAFPLGADGNSENTPEPTGLQARNNPSLLETFAREETKWNVGDEDADIDAFLDTSPVLSATSSVLDMVEWKINSLDSGGTDTQQSEPSLIRTTDGAIPASVDTASTWDTPCPIFSIVGTRDDFGTRGGQIQPLPDDKSLFVCLNSVDTNGAQAGVGGMEFKTYTDDNFGLGSFGLGTIPALGVDTGARMEREFEGFIEAEYCNLKSHFWNGLADDTTASISGGDVDKPFTTNDSGLSGKLPLFWRRKDDCGTNQTDDNRYFKDLVNDGIDPPIRVTSDLDRPLGLDGVLESEAYHGINIAYGTFHTDYIDSLGTDGVDNGAIPILDYVVEVIRGGSVYHRDIYRLANGQSAWSPERSIAEKCFPCNREDILDITLECNNPSDAGQHNGEQQLNKMDTLYQVGTDGEAWREEWYNPSDWRAGDIIRIYAIQPRLVGDKVFKIIAGTGFSDDTSEELQVVANPSAENQISPTPLITRIKKFCPVGEWDPKPDCCIDNTPCADGTVCVVVCTIPPGNGVGGIDIGGNPL